MIVDTNLLIDAVRKDLPVPSRLVIPVVIVGELEAFALKSDWGVQKVNRMKRLFTTYSITDITVVITKMYAEVDAFSQGKLKDVFLNTSARNMSKNDIWIAATALYLNIELHTTDNDFDRTGGPALPALGLRLAKH